MVTRMLMICVFKKKSSGHLFKIKGGKYNEIVIIIKYKLS